MRHVTIYSVYILATLFCLPANPLAAQQETLKWGKVSEQELGMDQYRQDTTCEAVILGDVGLISMKLVDGLKYAFRHHRRIKILDSLAFKEGNIAIPYYSLNNAEKISQIKAHIIHPDGSRQSLGRREIFDEPIDKEWSIKRILYPELQVGSIIEYRYEILSERIHTLRDWFFQSHLPVKYSELVVEIPQYYDYVYFLQTNQKPISIESSNSTVDMETDDRNTMENDTKVHIETKRYVMENIPAMRAGPYTTTMNDYRACMRFELSRVTYPSGRVQRFLPSWDELEDQLKMAPDFGQQYLKEENHQLMIDAAANILKQKLSDEDMLRKLYYFLSQSVKWDGTYSAHAKKDINTAWVRQKASSGTINLMLLALLREAKIKAYPLLISTRSHGKMIQQYPIIDQFNHCLVYALIDKEPIILDAGDPLRPPGLLRVESLNEYGWLMGQKKNEWIRIPTDKEVENYLAICKLNSEGQLSGRVEGSFKGNYALKLRRSYLNKMDSDYWEEMLTSQYAGVRLDSSFARNLDMPESTLETYFNFEIDEGAIMVNGRLHLKPIMLSRYFTSVLTEEVRKFPVNIPSPIKEQFVMLLDIPEGYTVESMPEGLRVLIYDDGGDFNYLISQKDNQLKLISRINIRKTQYSLEEYDDIKEFFDHIAVKFAEPIVLRKLEK